MFFLHSTGNPYIAKVAPDAASKNKTEFFHDVVRGLSSTPKSLPCKYLYDERGSLLFDQICLLDEYYPTRTELAIMSQHAPAIGAQFPGRVMLVEFGSGSSLKTRRLLDPLRGNVTYVPVDISREHLYRSARRLAQQYPKIDVQPVCADFTGPFQLPRKVRADEQVLVYFPGSTIGNFLPHDACQLLARIRELSGPRGSLLIGIDLQKDQGILEAAYNDRRGVTAEFNLNLLGRINRELGGTFELDSFAHRAIYNARLGRMELSLVSLADQSVQVGDRHFAFAAGEAICTEYSHKYRIDSFADLAARAGLTLESYWTDARHWFAVLLLVAAK